MLIELENIDGTHACINPRFVAAVRPHDPGTVQVWCNGIPYPMAIVKGEVSDIGLALSMVDNPKGN